MRRSICYCEPNHAMSGEVNTWKFIYTTAVNLPKGTLFRFDLMSDGREIDWEIPSINLKKNSNVIYAKLENGKVIPAKEIQIPDSWTPVYEFELPVKLDAGGAFTVVVGSPKPIAGAPAKQGTKAQTFSQRRRPFLLYIDATGKRHFEDPEVFSLDIRGNALRYISILTPSFVARNKRFDVTVRFEDEFGNLTANAAEDTLVELSYEQLRENLSWKLFVPETGFITIPNLYFNESGIYTIQLKNNSTKEIFRSPPIKCFNENEKSLFWGFLHGESIRVDSTENIENCMRHIRDEKAMNFFGTSPFESQEETPNEIWKLISQNVTEFEEGERFTTFLGFQWQGQPKTEGVRHFIWAKDSRPILRKKEAKYNTLSKIYKSFSPKELISIPCFTMGKGFEYDFKHYNPEFERVVEIYNSWGCSERTQKEGNPFPIKGPTKKGVQETAEGSVIQALLKNHRFGFVAGGLDDRGCYAEFFEGGQEQYAPGITAIISKEHSRSSLYESLYQRSCYATTGERMIMGFYIAGLPMGTETNTADKHGLLFNRHISGYVAGTTKLRTIEIIRNGETVHTLKPDSYHLDFTWDDLEPLKDVCIEPKDKRPPFVFYYLRATQENGHMAWSSPIWVDYIPGKAVRKNKPVASKPLPKKEEPIEQEDFDDLED